MSKVVLLNFNHNFFINLRLDCRCIANPHRCRKNLSVDLDERHAGLLKKSSNKPVRATVDDLNDLAGRPHASL